tara:strand:+ start:5820 stop:11015 length:5196 start_codon:yes stop_codon:yes gene_type:complete
MRKISLLIIILLSLCQNIRAQCLGPQSYTITPAGPYSPGQTVTVSYTLTSFTQVNINWIHCFDLDLGPGWVIVTPISPPANPGGSSGNWIWDNQHTFPSGLNFGPGWRFQNNGNPDWGTSSTGPFSMSFELTASQNCLPEDLYIGMETYGDCQTGGWSNGACCTINPFTIYTGYITANSVANISSTTNNISCFGQNDGSINLSLIGGNPPFSFQWSNGLSSQNINNLPSGTYNVNITDSIGCTSNINGLNINEPPEIITSFNYNNVTCNNGNDGNATILTLNTQIASVLWSNGQTNINNTLLSAGTYNVLVTDTNGCSISDSITIHEPPAINFSVNTSNVSCFGGNNGIASINIQNNTNYGTISNLNYCNSQPGSNSYSNIEEVILIGDSSIINNNTSNLCDQYENYTNSMYADLTEGQSYNLSITTGDCNGMGYLSGGKVFIDWNIDGDFLDAGEEVGIIPYGSPGSISISINVPSIGVYGPTRMRVVSQYLSSQNSSNITPCDYGIWNPIYSEPWFGSTEDYSIVVKPSSVNTNFIWSTGQTNDSISNLSAGNYSVDVIDGNGCVSTEFFYITEPNTISVNTIHSNTSCYGLNDGSFTLNILGGTPNYTVNTGGISQILLGSSNTFTSPNNLSAGTYIFNILDSNGCIYNNSVLISSPSQITTTEIINDVSCFGSNDGNVNLIIFGGTPNYTQDWAGFNPNSLNTGIYNYTITDNNGCTYTDSILISEPSQLEITYNYSNVSSCNGNDGSIDVSVSGGSGIYNYYWSNGQTTQDITNLPAGTYFLIVTDNNFCTDSISVLLTEPSLPSINYTQTNVSCNGFYDGGIDLSMINGAYPYQYIWSNGQTSEDIYNISAGNYTVIVTDNNNCSVTENIIITEPAAININYSQNNVSNCFGNDGNISISAIGGYGSYNFEWFNNNLTSIFIGDSIYGLYSGIYYLTVTDSNNCSSNFNFNITEPTGITVTENITNVDCYGNNTGQVLLNINGGQSPFIENWGGYNPQALNAGTYTYTVTDNLNCSFTNTIQINEPLDIVINENIMNVLCSGENSGVVTLNISGGTQPYIEDWLGFNPLSLYEGTYYYNIIDANGCQKTQQVYISEPDSLISSTNIVDASCYNYSDGIAIITTTGGTQPYIYNWYGANNLSLYAGTYNVLTTDQNGCNYYSQFIISQPNEMQITKNVNNVSCNGYSDGNVNLSITGGNPPFNENWLSQNPLNLPYGMHNFFIIDSNGCIQNDSVFVNQPSPINTNKIITNVLCNGDSNGTARIEIFGGTSPYSEDWNGVNTNNLSKGLYNYSVTDSNGCFFSDFIYIDEPNPIQVDESISNVNCFNSNNGTVSLTISGGTYPYIENWYGYNPLMLTAGEYNYSIIDSNNCIFNNSVIINQANQIIVDISIESPICIYDSTELSINIMKPLCNLYTIDLYDGVNSSLILVDSLGMNINTGEKTILTPQITTNYNIVSITDEEGCLSSVMKDFNVIVYPLPELTLDIPNFCTKDSSLFLDYASPTGGVYLIEGNSTSFFDIENLDIGTYTVEYQYNEPISGCYNSISTDIQLNENPIADFEYGLNKTDIDNPIIEFKNTSKYYNYQIWEVKDLFQYDNLNEFSYSFPEIGTYMVNLYVENMYGCIDSISKDITIYPVFQMYIPNSFTPNLDDKNELFGPIFRSDGYKSFSMKIINRWGEKVFDNENQLWDGTFKERICEDGYYSYVIIGYDFLDNPHIKTGKFLLFK